MYRHPIALEIESLIESTVVGLGCELVGAEFKPSQYGSLLRLYIDAENGVGLAECEKVSRQVGALLDVHDPIQNEYNLEVSSPGTDRPLFKLEHFQVYAGERAKLVLSSAYQGRRRFTGILGKVKDDKIEITLDDGQLFAVPFDMLTEGRLAPLSPVLTKNKR
jgi:ribosome maturation factor RimP